MSHEHEGQGAPHVDVSPDDVRWGHADGPGDRGLRVHYVRTGDGAPVVLLHGWPGFWYDWRRVLPLLAGGADVVAPDLRGFGRSAWPDGPPEVVSTPRALAADVSALLDHLRLDAAVVVGHDLGATVAQALARAAPARVRALVLCNPPYPGIGLRRFDPSVQPEFWYQHLHALPWAERLIGHDRETVRLYLAHFYDHWAGRKEAVRPREFDWIVDAYARPGAMRASIAYYRARTAERLREATADPPAARIAHPTVVVWGEADPVMRAAWSDRLPEYFADVTLRLLPGVGHFVPIEAPDEVVAAVHEALARPRV